MVDRGEAQWIDERSILLRAECARDRAPQAAAPAPAQSPTFHVTRRHVPVSTPQGFNRYPIDPEGSVNRWKREKKKAA
jgi:hypothetical protein